MFLNVILRSGLDGSGSVVRRENPAGTVGAREFLMIVSIFGVRVNNVPKHGG
jgi:hypothetical protein